MNKPDEVTALLSQELCYDAQLLLERVVSIGWRRGATYGVGAPCCLGEHILYLPIGADAKMSLWDALETMLRVRYSYDGMGDDRLVGWNDKVCETQAQALDLVRHLARPGKVT